MCGVHEVFAQETLASYVMVVHTATKPCIEAHDSLVGITNNVHSDPFSTVTYFPTNNSEMDRTIVLILVRVCEGYKIKKDILHPFIPHTSFLKLYKIGK